jgi:hypothetical protein
MQKKGTTVALAAYHGIALTMLWPPPNPPLSNTFVSGDATGNGDITGAYHGSRFPKYGSVKCIDPFFHPITCPGKAFLYSFTLNATSFEIGFHTSPKMKITNTRPYPGTKCIIANLEHLKTWVWQILNMPYAEPVGGRLSIRSGPPLTFSGSGGAYFFAYVCK